MYKTVCSILILASFQAVLFCCTQSSDSSNNTSLTGVIQTTELTSESETSFQTETMDSPTIEMSVATSTVTIKPNMTNSTTTNPFTTNQATTNQTTINRNTSNQATTKLPIASGSNDEVIISTLDGTFNGWNENTVFQLTNGQVWQQDSYDYEYAYEYRPTVTIVNDGISYKMFVDGVDKSVYVKRVDDSNIIKTSIDGTFNGWDGDTVVQLRNGQIWQQTSPAMKTVTKTSPSVIIIKDGSKNTMFVDGVDKSVLVKRIDNSNIFETSSVIKSNINGVFEGWDGDTIFQLTNGQVWQQTSFNYNYAYKYSPAVTIVNDGISYKMFVDGIDESIYVKRLV